MLGKEKHEVVDTKEKNMGAYNKLISIPLKIRSHLSTLFKRIRFMIRGKEGLFLAFPTRVCVYIYGIAHQDTCGPFFKTVGSVSRSNGQLYFLV